MKTCTVCKETLDYSHYHKSKLIKDGYGYRCKLCDRAARHSYREANRERFAEVTRRKTLKFKFGLSLEDYAELLKGQGGVCAVCGTDNPHGSGKNRGWSFSVDHCHETGKIRGLLCNNCNRGLGLLGDTSTSLRKAYEYLLKSEQTH